LADFGDLTQDGTIPEKKLSWKKNKINENRSSKAFWHNEIFNAYYSYYLLQLFLIIQNFIKSSIIQ